MTNQLAIALAKRFIAQTEVKAIQHPNGYSPVTEGKDGPYIPWSMADVEAHLAGTSTFGHYLVNAEDKCKLFCFDIDLVKVGSYPERFDYTCFDSGDRFIGGASIIMAREAWRDRRHPARTWLKWQLGFTAQSLATAISKELELPVAAAYSGYKGVHVYGFTGDIPASEARVGALLVLESLGCWKQGRGQSLFFHEDQSVIGFPNVNIEVYPKQDSLEGKKLGNLLRLPLGKNLKAPEDPTFFVDFRQRISALAPHSDPYSLIRSGNPWA